MATKSNKQTASKTRQRSSKKATAGKSSAKKANKKTIAASKKVTRFVVAPKSNRWTVKRVGSDELREFNTQADAIAAATKSARNTYSDVVIHRKDGTIRDRVSTAPADLAMLKLWKFIHQNTSSPKRR
jgi:hypothetical protein